MRYPALDGLRGVAILLVLLQHSGALPIGWMGVDLFFALSGFLITGILLDAKAAASCPRDYYVPFYARRALRILPIAMLTLVAFFIVLPVRRPDLATPSGAQLWYWLYLSNWRVGGHSAGALVYLRHFWSLAVEEQFYLVWPAVVLWLGARSLRRLCLILIGVSIVTRCVLLFSPYRWTLNVTGLTVCRWDGLAMGALAAIVARQPGGLAPYRSLLVTAVVACTAVVATCLLVQRGPGDAGWAMASVGLSVLGIAAGAFVALAVSGAQPVLEWAPLRSIGTVSYGLYVYHHPIAIWLETRIPSVAVHTVALIALSLPIATASWYGFERPILSAKKWFPMPAVGDVAAPVHEPEASVA